MKSQTTPNDASALKGRTGVRRIFEATGYSWAGLKAAFAGEAAFRQLVLLSVILIPIALWLDVSKVERAVLVLVCLLSLVVELINSAIEATVDRISLELHPLAKQAKDLGSSAQFVAMSIIVLTWVLILF